MGEMCRVSKKWQIHGIADSSCDPSSHLIEYVVRPSLEGRGVLEREETRLNETAQVREVRLVFMRVCLRAIIDILDGFVSEARTSRSGLLVAS